jgi:hypothetical protein
MLAGVDFILHSLAADVKLNCEIPDSRLFQISNSKEPVWNLEFGIWNSKPSAF